MVRLGDVRTFPDVKPDMEEKDGHEEPVFVSKDFAKAMAMSAAFNRDVKDADGTVYSVVPAPSDFSLGPRKEEGE